MKLRYITSSFAILLLAVTLLSADYFLLPEMFMSHKGETVSIHMLTGFGLDKAKEDKYQPAQTAKLNIYEGGKKTDLKPLAKDTSSIINYKLNNSGSALVEMERNYVDVDRDRSDLMNEIDEEGLTKIYDKVNNAGQTRFNVRVISYLKTLIAVDNASGSLYNKELGHTLEITLQQNPYKLDYGDDVTVMVKLKGKPLGSANIDLVVKTVTGKIYPQRLSTDAAGIVYFKVNRQGIYMLRMVSIQPSTLKNIDYEEWRATYTFCFTNTGTMPSTYKEFGMGNIH